jgi:hypothetical protein
MKAETEIKIYDFLDKYQLHASIIALVLSLIAIVLSLYSR